MAYKNDILLGRITRIHSLDGSVTVRLEKSNSQNILKMESVFLEIEGRLVPFFISSSEYSGAEILKLKFEDYDSFEKLREFQACRIFLTSDKKDDTLPIDITELAGFSVFMQDDKFVGSIKEVIKNPQQWLLCVVSDENKEILIPYHDHFIIKADYQKRFIIMNLPDGLIGINS
jgi:16S rRNA processing protein RimM